VKLAISDLDHKLSTHDDLSDQVEDLLLEDAASLQREQEDREARDDVYSELKAKLYAFKERLSVWAKGSALCTELETRFTTDDPANTAFIRSFDRFESSVSEFRILAVSHLHDEPILVCHAPQLHELLPLPFSYQSLTEIHSIGRHSRHPSLQPSRQGQLDSLTSTLNRS